MSVGKVIVLFGKESGPLIIIAPISSLLVGSLFSLISTKVDIHNSLDVGPADGALADCRLQPLGTLLTE